MDGRLLRPRQARPTLFQWSKPKTERHRNTQARTREHRNPTRKANSATYNVLITGRVDSPLSRSMESESTVMFYTRNPMKTAWYQISMACLVGWSTPTSAETWLRGSGAIPIDVDVIDDYVILPTPQVSVMPNRVDLIPPISNAQCTRGPGFLRCLGFDLLLDDLFGIRRRCCIDVQ